MSTYGYDPILLGLDVRGYTSQTEALVVCPFHNDTKPSATFNTQRGLFHCFACGIGLTITRLCESLGVSVDVTEITSRHPREKIREENEKIASLMLAPKAFEHPYLIERGVSDESVEAFDIRAIENWVLFPHKTLSGRICGFQLRSIHGARQYISIGEIGFPWPFSFVDSYDFRNRPVFVVEGPFGAIRAFQSGVQAVSCTGAANVCNIMRHLAGLNVVGLFDDDIAGYLAAANISIRFGKFSYLLGGEADEMTTEEWRNVEKEFLSGSNLFTGSVKMFATRIHESKRERFEYLVSNVIKYSTKQMM